MIYPPGVSPPKTGKRSIHCDPEHRAAWFNGDTQAHETAGVLKDGMWRGDCYSNGITESENPTALEEVEQALHKNIEMVLAYHLH